MRHQDGWRESSENVKPPTLRCVLGGGRTLVVWFDAGSAFVSPVVGGAQSRGGPYFRYWIEEDAGQKIASGSSDDLGGVVAFVRDSVGVTLTDEARQAIERLRTAPVAFPVHASEGLGFLRLGAPAPEPAPSFLGFVAQVVGLACALGAALYVLLWWLP